MNRPSIDILRGYKTKDTQFVRRCNQKKEKKIYSAKENLNRKITSKSDFHMRKIGLGTN